MMKPVFRFIPVSFSWVAIHPEPKGVVQFIGGAFFGTFPTIFYRYFLRKIFEEGYTVVALPFRFSFQHWSIAASLLKEQEILRPSLIDMANRLGYENQIYQKQSAYFWLAHSLGCKYIALLEFLSSQQWPKIASTCIEEGAYQWIENSLSNTGLESISILDQPSLLVAPDISDTESAIPFPILARLLDRIGVGVKPTRSQTQCFIEKSILFNLTALISFSGDNVAGSETDRFKSEKVKKASDVLFFIKQLENRRFPLLQEELQGKHLEPLGIRMKKFVAGLKLVDKSSKLPKSRQLEQVAIQFLKELNQRKNEVKSAYDT